MGWAVGIGLASIVFGGFAAELVVGRGWLRERGGIPDRGWPDESFSCVGASLYATVAGVALSSGSRAGGGLGGARTARETGPDGIHSVESGLVSGAAL